MIEKIDKETRLRFKVTFDRINVDLQEKFPKLFGGKLQRKNLNHSSVGFSIFELNLVPFSYLR